MPALERYEDGDFNVIASGTGITSGASRFWITKYDDPTFYKYTLAGVADGTVSRSTWGRAAGLAFANGELITVHDGSPGEARGWAQTGGSNLWRFGFESTNTRGRGVCFDGRFLWVVDTNSTKNPTSSVYKYETDGTFVAKYGISEVSAASGIVPFNGGLLISNQTDATLHYYTTELEYIDEYTLDAANSTPNGLAIEGEYLYVLQTGKVYSYHVPDPTPFATRETVKEFSLASGNTSPRGIAFLVDRFWVAGESSGAYSYSTIGAQISNFAFASLNRNVSGCTSYDDLLWIPDKSDRKVYVYDIEGDRQASREFNLHSDNANPNGITYGNNHFWVADTDLNVYKYTINGTYVSKFPLYDNIEVHGITYNEGQIWVLDKSGKIHSYLERGTYRESHRLDAGNGHPEGITFHDGVLYVVDTDDSKVYSYTLGIDGVLKFLRLHRKIPTPYPRGYTIWSGALSQNRPIPESDVRDVIFVSGTSYRLVTMAPITRQLIIDGRTYPLDPDNSNPAGVAFKTPTRIFVGDNTDHAVFEYSSNATHIATHYLDLAFTITDLTFIDNRWYIIDGEKKTVYVYDQNFVRVVSLIVLGIRGNIVNLTRHHDFVKFQYRTLSIMDDTGQVYRFDSGFIHPQIKRIPSNDITLNLGVEGDRSYLPWGVIITDSNIYTVNGYRGSASLSRYSSSGVFDINMVSISDDTFGLTTFDNLLWAVSGSGVDAYSTAGVKNTSKSFTLHADATNPQGITFGAGHFWILANKRIFKYTSTGHYVSQTPVRRFGEYFGIAFHNDLLYIGMSLDRENYAISVQDLDGTHIRTYGFERSSIPTYSRHEITGLAVYNNVLYASISQILFAFELYIPPVILERDTDQKLALKPELDHDPEKTVRVTVEGKPVNTYVLDNNNKQMLQFRGGAYVRTYDIGNFNYIAITYQPSSLSWYFAVNDNPDLLRVYNVGRDGSQFVYEGDLDIRALASVSTPQGLATYEVGNNSFIMIVDSSTPRELAVIRAHGVQTPRFVVRADLDPDDICLLYTSPSPRDRQKSRMPSSA